MCTIYFGLTPYAGNVIVFVTDGEKLFGMLQSQSSAVTDDEGKDSSSTKHGTERIIRTVYAQNKVCGYSTNYYYYFFFLSTTLTYI